MRTIRWIGLISAFILLFAAPQVTEALQIGVGYVVPNFQVFPVGDFVDPDQIEGGGDLDFASMPRFFYLEMIAGPGEETDSIYIHLELLIGGQSLVDFYSDPFTVDDWTSEGTRFYNDQLDPDLRPWYSEGPGTSYADPEDFLALIEGGFLRAATYFLTFQVYHYTDGARGSLWQTTSMPIQVYTPSQPDLLEPSDGTEVNATPILFRWNWFGGPTSPSDWTFILVQGDEGEDGETVILSRNLANTRFEGSPQSPQSHFYTGVAGLEQALDPGAWYYWRVEVNVQSVLQGRMYHYASNVFSFQLAGVGGGGGGGGGGGFGGGLGGGGGGGGGGGLGGVGGGGAGGGGGGGFGGEPPGPPGPPPGGGGGGDIGGGGLGGGGGQGGRGPGGEGGGGNQPGGNDPTFDVLNTIFSPGDLADLMTRFQGFSSYNIMFQGVSGRSMSDLSTFINQQGFQVTNWRIEE